jgi:glycosyltransferase involved in cell wall biosynthesis
LIVIFDAMAWGFEHVPFNGALLASAGEAFPGEPITFFGSPDHLELLQSYLRPRFDVARVAWRDLALPQRMAKPQERIGRDFLNCRLVLSEAQRLGAKRVLSCYLHATSGVLALKALNWVTPGIQVAFVHHGSLVRVLGSRRNHPLLALGNGGLRQIVLAPSIRAEMLAKIPALQKSLYAIHHPYFFQDVAPSSFPQGPTTFSFLGLVDETKGFHDFVDLAATFGQSHLDAVRFDLIGGRREGSFADAAGPWVKTYGSEGPIPREVFEKQLGETTYAVFPYEPEHYKLVASGSILDAFTAGKPLIVLRNSQFQELFETMGDIGYMCNDVAEIKRTVESILRDPPRERYRRQSENILRGRRAFEPPAVGAELRAIFGA